MTVNAARHNVHFEPDHTVLLVIDPVNEFLHEDGAAWEMTKSTVKKNDIVAQLQRLTAGARAAGVPVLFGPMAYTAEDYADGNLQRRTGINRLMFENRMFQAGTFGADTAHAKLGTPAAQVGALYRSYTPTGLRTAGALSRAGRE